jgi:hypothetical protein
MCAVEGIGVETTAELLSFSRDFVDRPEVLSKIFQDDFKLSVVDAHSFRSAMMHLLRSQKRASEVADLYYRYCLFIHEEKIESWARGFAYGRISLSI